LEIKEIGIDEEFYVVISVFLVTESADTPCTVEYFTVSCFVDEAEVGKKSDAVTPEIADNVIAKQVTIFLKECAVQFPGTE
jgi:hypothetical protein